MTPTKAIAPRSDPKRPHANLFGFYCDNRVNHPSEMPEGPHWAAILFGSRDVYTPGWGHNDPGCNSKEADHQYYVFRDEAELAQFIDFCHMGKKPFVFFKVEGQGRIQKQVSFSITVKSETPTKELTST